MSASTQDAQVCAEPGRSHVNARRTRLLDGRAVDAGSLASRRSEPSSSNDDGGLGDCDSESSSDPDECSSEDEQGRSSTSKHSQWDNIDDCRVERHDHPIVHYIVVVERSCKNISIPNWKENRSELTSQRLEVPELW